jgi:L-glutamine-phosphate cytidylyltransferase
MRIAISQRHQKNQRGEDIDILEQSYISYFTKLGFTLIPVPNNLTNVAEFLENINVEGVILSGGNDVSSQLYGGNIESNSQSSSRDKTEHQMVNYCIQNKIPLLGICRGIQFLNVYFGGKLVTFNDHLPGTNHQVNCFESELGEAFNVNSYHNQGFTENELGNELKVFARDSNIIEGIYHPDLPIAAIQWHPERESPNKEINEKIVLAFRESKLFWRAKNPLKAIILAAGMGTRLGKYTDSLPKCMLEFNGKTLIQRQVDALRAVGITDITIVRGYMPNKINIEGVKYRYSPHYNKTNMVETLFCAEDEMEENDGILICYADILYQEDILKKIISSNVDIGVAVDEDYWEYWQARADKPEDDMESLIITDNKIVELGNTNCTRNEAIHRYVGLIKFSKSGIDKLRKVYHFHKNQFYDIDSPWLRSKSFKKAYMTCMLQALINSGQEVKPIIINRGWLEFDTVEDYEKYTKWLQDGSLSRFMILP